MKVTAVRSCGTVYYAEVFLTFESANEIIKYGHSYESYRVLLTYGAAKYAVQGGSFLFNQRANPKNHSPVPGVLFIMLYKMNESVDEILLCNHSNESY